MGTERTEFSLSDWFRLRGFFGLEKSFPLSCAGSREVEETEDCFAVDFRDDAELRVLYDGNGSCSEGILIAPGFESCFSAKGTR